MLEVFAYKKYKKHKLTKQLREQNATEALTPKEESFFRRSFDQYTEKPKSFLRVLHKGKATEIPPTNEELSAVDPGAEGAATPTTQEHDLAEALASLNLAVKKVPHPPPEHR